MAWRRLCTRIKQQVEALQSFAAMSLMQWVSRWELYTAVRSQGMSFCVQWELFPLKVPNNTRFLPGLFVLPLSAVPFLLEPHPPNRLWPVECFFSLLKSVCSSGCLSSPVSSGKDTSLSFCVLTVEAPLPFFNHWTHKLTELGVGRVKGRTGVQGLSLSAIWVIIFIVQPATAACDSWGNSAFCGHWRTVQEQTFSSHVCLWNAHSVCHTGKMEYCVLRWSCLCAVVYMSEATIYRFDKINLTDAGDVAVCSE